MSQNEIIESLFLYPNSKFINHLSLVNNDRIIFSGKFGHGKSTFLRNFFDEKTQQKTFNKAKYNPIFLYPVNYSVASNEDIFRYIKYDIITEIANQNYPVEESTKSFLKNLPKFLKKNLHKIAASLVYMIPLIGKDVVDSWENIDELKNDFITFSVRENEGESDKFNNYLEKLELSEGNIFENDIISKLIEEILKRKKQENESENILIIDDLDRIDPEHIFRILNVFAAHFDRDKVNPTLSKNKFGFDKVMIVCDIDNIRQIFSAKYGVNTDFNGYIDKFYSNYIFKFNNKTEIIKVAKNKILSAGWNIDDISESSTFTQKYINDNNALNFLLELLIEYNQLDLRNILKWKTLKYTHQYYFYVDGVELPASEFPLIIQLKILIDFVGDAQGLKISLDKLENNIPASFYNSQIYNSIRDLLYILTVSQHKNDLRNVNCTYILANKQLAFKGDENSNLNFQDYHSQGISRYFTLYIDALKQVIDLISIKDL